MSVCPSDFTTDWNKVLKVIKSVDDIKQVDATLEYVSLYCKKHNMLPVSESEILRQTLITIELKLNQKYYGNKEDF